MKLSPLYYALVLLCQLLFFITAHSQVKKIYLQPKTVAKEKQSKYVDSLHFIPLERKDEIELGAYYNIQVAKNYLLLVDYLNKRLIVYSKDGRFIKNISYKRLGGDFYPNYQEYSNKVLFLGNNKNYTLTPKDHIKIKLDWANPRNKKYFKKYTLDLNDSSLAIKKETPDEKDIIHVQHFYDDYYLQSEINVSSLYKDSLDYEIKLYKNNQLVKAFYPYNPINEQRYIYSNEYVAFSKTDTPSVRLVSRPFCDTVYKLVKDSLFPIYQFVLPLENSLPGSFYTKPFKNKTERENFNRNNGWVFNQLLNFYETPRYIFFLVHYLSNYESYVYEKETKLTYKTKNLRADSSQYNIALISDFGIERRNNWLYKPLKASDILPFFEKNKNVPPPKELEAFLKSEPPGTTPVIAVFKLKN